MVRAWLKIVVALAISLEPVRAIDKIAVLDEAPAACYRLRVQGDGKRVFIAGQGEFIVFDEAGRMLDRFAPPEACSAVKLFPRPDGWYIACLSYAHGQSALYRPDGTYAKTPAAKSGPPHGFRGDMTGWTSPCNAAVDFENNRIFGVDTCMAPRDDRKIPDPDWSRIAVFDLEGKHLLDINAYDAYAPDAKEKDSRRTWYDDIEVDPKRQRLYATARASGQVLAFSYDGQLLGSAPGRGPLAVFPDGRIATIASNAEIAIYDRDLKDAAKIPVPEDLRSSELRDLDADAAGRLYATFGNASVFFARWSADLAQVEVIGPRFLKISVQYPDPNQAVLEAGKQFTLLVKAAGRPSPDPAGPWQVMARPLGGSDLQWRALPSSYADGKLAVETPPDLAGIYLVAVRYGQGPLAWAEHLKDPAVRAALAFLPGGAQQSAAIIPASGRRVYQAGEAMRLHLIHRSAAAAKDAEAPLAVRLELRQGSRALAAAALSLTGRAALEIPRSITARLAPAEYELAPVIEGAAVYPFYFAIVSPQPDSPLQRIAYHEFGDSPMAGRQHSLVDDAERMAYIRDYCRAMQRLGFTRETDRLGGSGTALSLIHI
ncbi:MAG: hypothetical protein N3A66_04045, partial [Planctomycetota bacterium]|nr:hypothetical protein [Planctomycetota bacterium]